MKERPILFSGPMVRAILEGRKTMTRRVVKRQPAYPDAFMDMEPRMIGSECQWFVKGAEAPYNSWHCAQGGAGDRLWVRESLVRPDGDPWCYKADNQPVMVDKSHETEMLAWAHHKEQDHCVSIHMPRWASRLTLELTEVRVERLQDITETDARAEGIQVLPLQSSDDPSAWWQSSPGVHQDRTARGSFIQLWDSINAKKHPWESNPWVWVESFRKVN